MQQSNEALNKVNEMPPSVQGKIIALLQQYIHFSSIVGGFRPRFLRVCRDVQRGVQAFTGCRTNFYARMPRTDWSRSVT